MYTESNIYYYSTEIDYIKKNSQKWKHNSIVGQLYSVKRLRKLVILYQMNLTKTTFYIP